VLVVVSFRNGGGMIVIQGHESPKTLTGTIGIIYPLDALQSPTLLAVVLFR
jgi:hypothetical protein